MRAIVYLALALVRKSAPPSPADTEQRCRLSLKQRVRAPQRATMAGDALAQLSANHPPPLNTALLNNSPRNHRPPAAEAPIVQLTES